MLLDRQHTLVVVFGFILPLHAQHGIVAVLSFTVAVFGFALISSHLAWYHCSIQLHSSGIQLCPHFLKSDVVSL